MRWILMLLAVSCFAWGCDKEIHEARTPLHSTALASAQ